MKISRRNFLKVLGSATMAGALAACAALLAAMLVMVFMVRKRTR